MAEELDREYERASREREIDVRLPIVWTKGLAPCGNDTRHLIGTLDIAGALHHIEAFEVHDVDGCQESVAPSNETNFDELSEIVQGAMMEVVINDRPYVLLVTPFQS